MSDKNTNEQDMINTANYIRNLSKEFSILDIAKSNIPHADKELLVKACFLWVQEKQQESIKKGVY